MKASFLLLTIDALDKENEAFKELSKKIDASYFVIKQKSIELIRKRKNGDLTEQDEKEHLELIDNLSEEINDAKFKCDKQIFLLERLIETDTRVALDLRASLMGFSGVYSSDVSERELDRMIKKSKKILLIYRPQNCMKSTTLRVLFPHY
jgi:hypothetical protein